MDMDLRRFLKAEIFSKAAVLEGRFEAILVIDNDYRIGIDALLILDMTSTTYNYPTVILDVAVGVVATTQRTRQLISHYLDHSPFTLVSLRVIKDMAALKYRMLPVCCGQVGFAPLASASHGESDWVGVYHLRSYQGPIEWQLKWHYGFRGQVLYTRDLEVLLHHVSVYGEIMVDLIRKILPCCGLELAPIRRNNRFSRCDCWVHTQIRQQQYTLQDFLAQYRILLDDCFYPKKEWPNWTIRLDYTKAAWYRYERLKKFN